MSKASVPVMMPARTSSGPGDRARSSRRRKASDGRSASVAKKAVKKDRAKTGPTYEEVRERLEDVVSRLERGESSLEEGLELYEEGVRLVRAAHGMLDAAEKRLEILKPMPDGSFRLADGSDVARGGGTDSGEDGGRRD